MPEDLDEARESIRALIRASADPNLSDAECRELVNKAIENSQIAFGPHADEELIGIAAEHTIETIIFALTAFAERSKVISDPDQ